MSLRSTTVRAVSRVVALGAAMLISTGAMAASLTGFLYSPFGQPWGDNPAATQRLGTAGAGMVGGGQTWGAAPVGWFGFSDLQNGTYSLVFGPKDQYYRHFVFGVSPGGPDVLTSHTPYYITGSPMHWASWALEYAQSFEALGDHVSFVSARFPAAAAVYATIHEGEGPGGPQIGPATIVAGSFANDSHGGWSDGQVPVIPGQKYTVVFRPIEEGVPFSMHYAAGTSMNSRPFPGGKTWIDGELFPHPLRTVIGFDNDGISTTMSTTEVTQEFAAVGQYVPSGVPVGQTFTATGTSVVGFSCLVGISAPFTVQVFEEPGPDGEGINPIGPEKWMITIAWNVRSNVSWMPGENPTVPGEQYYVKMKPVFPSTWVVYKTVNDEYEPGTMIIGSLDMEADISGRIFSEESTGSALTPEVYFEDWEVLSTTANSATIRWRTVQVDPSLAAVMAPQPLPATATVQYGSGSNYTRSVSVETPLDTHTLTLTDLNPGTEYHVRVRADAAGFRSGLSKDFMFVTQPERPNLVTNAGFESGALGNWKTWGSMSLKNRPASGSGGLAGVKARSGNWYAGAETNGLQIKGGLYQQIPVDSTLPVSLLARLWTYQVENNKGFDSGFDYTVLGRVGIDPFGGTDPNSPNVQWAPHFAGQQWYDFTPGYDGYHPSRYADGKITVQPMNAQVTVFLESGANNAITWNIYGWDDVYAWQPDDTPLEVESIGALKDIEDGTVVKLNDVVVTADEFMAGANYVQEEDRSAGIRVESPVPLTWMTRVTLRGVVQTKPSGERYLTSVLVLGDTFALDPRPLSTRVSWIGNNSGLSNVGLLMRTFGEVIETDAEYFVIRDGSTQEGIKVDTGDYPLMPQVGRYVEVAGIVQLEGNAPNAKPILRMRLVTDLVLKD